MSLSNLVRAYSDLGHGVGFEGVKYSRIDIGVRWVPNFYVSTMHARSKKRSANMGAEVGYWKVPLID